MNKAIKLSAQVLQLIFLAGAWAVYYFGKTRMGAARYFLYQGKKWHRPFFDWLIPLLLILLLLAAIWCAIRAAQGKGGKNIPARILLAVMFLAAFIFTLAFSPDTLRTYYQLLLVFGLILLLQFIKCIVPPEKNKQKKPVTE